MWRKYHDINNSETLDVTYSMFFCLCSAHIAIYNVLKLILQYLSGIVQEKKFVSVLKLYDKPAFDKLSKNL